MGHGIHHSTLGENRNNLYNYDSNFFGRLVFDKHLHKANHSCGDGGLQCHYRVRLLQIFGRKHGERLSTLQNIVSQLQIR